MTLAQYSCLHIDMECNYAIDAAACPIWLLLGKHMGPP